MREGDCKAKGESGAKTRGEVRPAAGQMKRYDRAADVGGESDTTKGLNEEERDRVRRPATGLRKVGKEHGVRTQSVLYRSRVGVTDVETVYTSL